MPKRSISSLMVAGVFIVVAIVALVYGITVNHVIFSTGDLSYTLPIFGITVDRGTLYDTTIVLIVASMVALVFLAFLLLDTCNKSRRDGCRLNIPSDAGWNRNKHSR